MRLRAGSVPTPANCRQTEGYIPTVSFPTSPLRQRGGGCSDVLALRDHSDHRAVARHRYKCSQNRISELGSYARVFAVLLDNVRVPTIRGRSGYDR